MHADTHLSALFVGEFEADRHSIRKLFDELGWGLFEAPSRIEAIECLDCNLVHVVILEAGLVGWDWKTVLPELRERAASPQLIVVSLHADETLWSEVLNAGGYDVMAQPLDVHEAKRVIASARRDRPTAAAGA
jgi:DNA-binding response OmpR family regulator